MSSSMEAVVLKATALSPEKRYASAVQLKQEIHQFLGGFSTSAEAPGFLKELRLFILRNRISAGIFFAFFAVLTLSSILFVQRLGHQKNATAEEYSRANKLMREVDVLSNEYNALSEKSAVTRKELADKLVQSANRVMILGVFDRPVWAVDDAMRLVNMALALDPASDAAKWMRYSLSCVQLNHRQALSEPPADGPYALQGITQWVAAFPDFDFTRDKRPDSAQFTRFLRQARLYEERSIGYLERVFAYHQATVPFQQDRLVDELAALVGHFNGGPEHCTMRYQDETHRLIVESDSEKFQLSAWGVGSRRCILRYLPVRHLELNISGNFNLKHLQHLNVETIDLGTCTKLRLDTDLHLPQLRRLTIRAGQFSREFLRAKIRTTDPFEIIEI